MHVIFSKSIACTMVKQKLLNSSFRGENIFSAHTGYGKSLIFQAIPIISDVLNDKVVGSSVVLVISPLISLMKDRVRNCNERLGIYAAAMALYIVCKMSKIAKYRRRLLFFGVYFARSFVSYQEMEILCHV